MRELFRLAWGTTCPVAAVDLCVKYLCFLKNFLSLIKPHHDSGSVALSAGEGAVYLCRI